MFPWMSLLWITCYDGSLYAALVEMFFDYNSVNLYGVLWILWWCKWLECVADLTYSEGRNNDIVDDLHIVKAGTMTVKAGTFPTHDTHTNIELLDDKRWTNGEEGSLAGRAARIVTSCSATRMWRWKGAVWVVAWLPHGAARPEEHRSRHRSCCL